MQREFDGECAANARFIANPQGTAVGFGPPSTDVETQAEAGAVLTALHEWDEESFWRSWREAPTMIFHGNEYAVIPTVGL